MSSVFQTRLSHIRQEKAKGSPRAIARVVRDLWARRERRGQLSNTEEKVWQQMTDTFTAEWAASMNMEQSRVKDRLFALLQHAKNKQSSAKA